MKKIIYLFALFSCMQIVLAQQDSSYFPLEVGNKWIYRVWSQSGGWDDEYFTRFEITGKEIINDTVYYIADNSLFSRYSNEKYFRKDSTGNVFIRCNNNERLLFKMNAEPWEIFSSSCYGFLRKYEGFLPYSAYPTCFPFGKIEDQIIFQDQSSKGIYFVFVPNFGCVIGGTSTEDPIFFLKRAINNGIIATPQITKIISIEYLAIKRKILMKTLAVMDTTTQIILNSKKGGIFKGSFLRYNPDPEWDAYNGPYYSIESNLDYSALGDTVRVTIPATVRDILGDRVDGNNNQIWEGSPIDDYIATIIIPSTPNKVDANVELPKYKLFQNYSNPFNPSTKIQYSIPEEGYVTLKVYDILGRDVRTLVSENKKHGNYEVNFDASSASGGLPSGVYFYKLQVNNFFESKKMFLVK